MLTSHVQKIARVLNILVLITFICNLAALPLVPGLVLHLQPCGAAAGTGTGAVPL